MSVYDARSTPRFNQGDLVRVIATFKDASDALIDPTSVSFQYKSAKTGTLVELLYGTDAALVRVSLGVYRVDIDTTPAGGVWLWRFFSLGTGQGAMDGTFFVYQSTMTPSTESDPEVEVVGALTASINEIPSGDRDGVNTAFAVSHIPSSGTLMLFLNGILLKLGTDYILDIDDESVITMIEAPFASDWLAAIYVYVSEV